MPHNLCLHKQVSHESGLRFNKSLFFNGNILVLNICNVFSLAVATVGHEHAILAARIFVLLITALVSVSRPAWKGETVFIV